MNARLRWVDRAGSTRPCPSRVAARTLIGVVLAALAPFAVAQMGAPGGQGTHAHQRDNASRQDCKKQADDRKLPGGPERHKFMRQCIEAKHSASDAARSEAARAKMGDPQSGHLHSDPPPPTSPPPGS